MDPTTYDIQAFPGVRFLSPVLSEPLKKLMRGREINPRDPVKGFISDDCLLSTDVMAFAFDDSTVGQYRTTGDDNTVQGSQGVPILEIAIPLLSALRYFSKQAGITMNEDSLNSWTWVEVERLPVFIPKGNPKFEWMIASRFIDAAVTRRHIDAACACPPDFRPPVFDGLLLDAMDAHAGHDYRKSVLYAAMSIETAISTVLDESYERDVKTSDDPRWRTIKIPLAGGVTVRKDPVWEVLRRKDDFGSLVHECALYILGRSLFVEDEALFQEAKRLYSTRNKIVHRGEPPIASDQYFPIDVNGSMRALICAEQVLSWIGVKEKYTPPRLGFQSVANAGTEAWRTGR